MGTCLSKEVFVDWKSFSNTDQDLQGFKGETRPITIEELRQHCKKTDCWVAIKGKVFNVTPYLKFHPGGVSALMEVAGKDGTAKFMETHRWVNFDSILQKVYLGPLVTGAGASTGSQLGAFLAPAAAEDKVQFLLSQDPDHVQLTVIIAKERLTEDGVVADWSHNTRLTAKVPFGQRCVFIHYELHAAVCDLKVKWSESRPDHIVMEMRKQVEDSLWPSFGKPLDRHLTVTDLSTADLIYVSGTLVSTIPLTHDTKMLTVRLPSTCRIPLPLTHHVMLRLGSEGNHVEKPYTPMPPTLSKLEDVDQHLVHFIIKIYPKGEFTPRLARVQSGDAVEISDSMPNVDVSGVMLADEVLLLAGGTGITPMIAIIHHVLASSTVLRKIVLLFGNRTEQDIIWKEEFSQLQCKQTRFQVHHTLSQPSSDWKGHRGRVGEATIHKVIEGSGLSSASTSTWIGLCGPQSFSETNRKALVQLGFKESQIHCFLG